MIIRNSISEGFKEVEFRNKIQSVRIGKFNDSLVEEVEKTVSKAHETGQPVIPFIIDSSGGEVFAFMSIYETIQSSEIPILTYLKGKAFSCGFLTLGFGSNGYRFASPHGSGMLHEITWGKRDKISEVEEMVDYGREINDYIYKELADHVGLKEDYYLELMYERDQKNADNWMRSEELLEHDIIDNIGSPKLTREAKVNWNFQQ